MRNRFSQVNGEMWMHRVEIYEIHFLVYLIKKPSQTLLQLMGIVVQAGQRFAAIADMQVGEGNQSAAVGTTMALLERGSRVNVSNFIKGLYVGMKEEFKLLAKSIFQLFLPPSYPYDVVGASRTVKQTDFDDRIDVFTRLLIRIFFL